jgi:hypothetical protein
MTFHNLVYYITKHTDSQFKNKLILQLIADN